MSRPIPGMVAALLTLLFHAAPATADANTFDHSHAAFTDILERYVTAGTVDYAALLADREGLDSYIDSLSEVRLREFQHWSNQQQVAYLINLYNAETLQLILDNYPVDSIKDIGSIFNDPWDLDVVNLFGKNVTLNKIEHGILRKNYREPRIHFALVCAARGCPPLRSEAYRASDLYQQLDEQARTFFELPDKNRVDVAKKTVYLSPILKWYAEDFGTKSARVLDYVSRYFPPDTAAALRTRDFSIRYTDYDWKLNDQE